MIDKMLIRGAKVHNLKNVDVEIPLGKIVGIAGVSGSGKSSLALGVLYAEGSRRYLEALSTYTRRRMTQASRACVDEILYVPAALALHQRPGVPGIRSTFGTGTELLNSLRLMYSRLASHRCPNGHYLAPSLAVAAGKELVCPECGTHFYAPSAEELAFNSQGACQKCGGTGIVSLDVQFLPDVDIPCPDCRGSRYDKAAYAVRLTNKDGASISLPELMDMDVNTALDFCKDMKGVGQKLGILRQLGLGYLTLGEETPGLSGGEAQRLKLASEIGKTQSDSVFVFDEPSIGLHPLDVQVLLGVFQALLDHGATVVVIEHDLDVIRNADYVIDMGPGGGEAGGRIIASGTPQEILENKNSITGKYLS